MTTATHSEPAHRASAGRAQGARLALWAPVLAVGGFCIAFIARSSFSFQGKTYYSLFDDAMISMRYAHNLADGHGLVWNAGQHVEGYSNLLWTLWMSLIHLVGVPGRYTSLVVMASCALLLLATLVVVNRLCALLVPGAPVVGVAAMLMTGLFYPLVFWSLRGMEVALAAFLITLSALLVIEMRSGWNARRCWFLAAVLGAAVLTRDDLLLPSAIVIAFAAWQLPRERRRRTLLILGGTVVAVVIGHEAFRLAYYGEALPNTYYLKLGGIPIRDRLLRGAESLLYAGLYSLAAPLVLAGAALFLRRRAAPLLLLAALFAAQCAYSVYVGGDAWEDLKFANRYVATAAPVLMVLAAVGGYEIASRALRSRSVAALGTLSFATLGVLLLILRAADRIPHSRLGLTGRPVTQLTPALLVLGCAAAIAVIGFAGRRDESHLRSARWGAGGALVLALLALASTSAGPAARWVRSNAQDTVVERLWTEMGVVIGEHTAPRARVAFVTAGNMPYFSQRPSVDLLGKMDPVVAHRPPTAIYPIRYRPGHNKWDYAYSIGRLRPQVVVSLWWQTRQDLCNMRRWGYEQIAPRLYVLRGAAGVDVPGLAAATERLGPGPGYPPAGAGCA